MTLRSTLVFITLAMDIPPVTLVIARNRISEMTAMEKLTVFTLAASWRRVNILRPRQYRPRALWSTLSRKPESPKKNRMVPATTMPVVSANWMKAASYSLGAASTGRPSRSRR